MAKAAKRKVEKTEEPSPKSLMARLAALQAEYHPYLDQSKVLAFCRKAGLIFMAYCPLGRGRGGRA